jgi:deoxyribodipyrimidine photo-lyase
MRGIRYERRIVTLPGDSQNRPMNSALVWFRRDLRLSDNAALHQALLAARQVHCVFVFDRDILDGLENRSDRRVEFIWESVAELRLALVRHGGGLHVLHGAARRLIPEMAAHLQVDTVFAARDYEPFAVARDTEVAAALQSDGRTLHLVRDQVIFEADDLLNAAGRPFHVFTPYKRAWLGRVGEAELAAYPVEALLAKRALPSLPSPLPTLQSLGFQRSDLRVRPGEMAAHALFAGFKARVEHYRETRDYPALQGTSNLSVHLRFGTISIRELARFAWRQNSEGAQTWLSELIWREFYQMLLWHYPETATRAFQEKYSDLPWPNPPGHFEVWCEARTGYPIVDAAMRRLNQTGTMHNRLRMIVASFLVKDLHVDWRLGERYFAEKLLDYDQAANVGGWQWSAGVGTDAQPWFRIFNPVTQSEKFDPLGTFIRRTLPELEQVPEKFIHAPWKMNATQQVACGVAIGADYPAPIVNHAQARNQTLALFRRG